MAGFGRRLGRFWPAGAVGVGVLVVVTASAMPRPIAARPGTVMLAGLLLVSLGALLMLRRLVRADAAAAEQQRRARLLADAAGRLARLREPAAIAAFGETMLRDLLGGDSIVWVAVGDAEMSPLPRAAEQRHLPLRGPDGALLGRIAAARADGRGFTSDDAHLLAELSRAVAGALSGAQALAGAAAGRATAERLLDAIADGLLLLDADWRVRYANQAACALLRSAPEDLIGMALWQRFPALDGSEFAARLQEMAEFAGTPQEPVGDFTALFPPLDAWFEMRCYPTKGGLVLFFRDVTTLREVAERQRQSQRLEVLGQLTGGLAHDMNNLLTVVLGNFEMLTLSAEERGAAGVPDLELAESGLRAGGNARQLMRRLLAFSRRQPLSPQMIDIGALLAGLEPLLRRSVGDAVTVGIRVPEGVWHALADPAELENALINLAVNARDAMPAGGVLTIEAANVVIDRVYAVIAGMERTGDYVMISVADNGSGMTDDVVEKAFDPFFSTKEPGKGTGLGLSMVYGFAKQSAGHVMIDSEPGEGTIVRLYLPRSAAPLPPPGEAEEAVRGGSETILLVEDNDLVRSHAEAVLRGLGYQVHAAASGQEVLRLLEKGVVRPDLLLTDLMLSGDLSGQQVADAAAGLVPGLRVLFTTGYPGGMLREAGAVAPDRAIIRKPFSRRELAAGVRRQLAGAAWRPTQGPPLAAGSESR